MNDMKYKVENKIGRNDPCYCGSGKKYKKCCYLIKQASYTKSDFDSIKELMNKAYKQKRIKQCLHPNSEECVTKIIKAHAIQNNKILKKLAVDGQLYSLKPKKNPFEVFVKWGRGEVTTFTGFCQFHDKMLFADIEDKDFRKTEEQCFKYMYRCLCSHLHAKQETDQYGEVMSSKKHEYYLGVEHSIKDFLYDKSILDTCLISEDYSSKVGSIIWEWDYEVLFTGIAFDSPTTDFEGRKLQDLSNLNLKIGHFFYTIFPENGRTYCIISWLKEFENVLNPLINKLNVLTDFERKIYLNNIFVKQSDEVVLSPKLFNSLTDDDKRNIQFASQGGALFDAFLEMDGPPANYDLSDPLFDLFKQY